MSQIISVVPNISEGRDPEFVESLREALEAVPGLVVLDVSMDQVRNRTILSFTGSREAVFEGGYLVYDRALEHIDMRQRGTKRSNRIDIAQIKWHALAVFAVERKR